MTVLEAMDFALAHHPRLRAQRGIQAVAAARVDAARDAYLPEVDLAAELNRATGNVVSGSLFTLPGVPNVSGPPTDRAFTSGVWGSATSLALSLDIAGLARKMALVDAALAEHEQVRAGVDAEALAVAFDAGDAFMTSVAASETMRANRANVERAGVFATIVEAQVAHALRPGADASRATADRALAETGLIRSEQAGAVAAADLARALGVAGQHVEPVAAPLLTLPPSGEAADTPSPRHPLLVQSDAATAAARAREHAVRLEYLPRVDIASAVWVRGSGLFPGGLDLGDQQGLVPDTPNWAAGMIVSWPLLGMFDVRARARQAAANVETELARHDDIAQAIEAQIDAARAILDGARRVAANTPVALAAARDTEGQARARYQAGLATVVEVAEAQRLLVQAEIDDAVARLAVWRALLLLARATGDLTPFTAEVEGAPAGGGH